MTLSAVGFEGVKPNGFTDAEHELERKLIQLLRGLVRKDGTQRGMKIKTIIPSLYLEGDSNAALRIQGVTTYSDRLYFGRRVLFGRSVEQSIVYRTDEERVAVAEKERRETEGQEQIVKSLTGSRVEREDDGWLYRGLHFRADSKKQPKEVPTDSNRVIVSVYGEEIDHFIREVEGPERILDVVNLVADFEDGMKKL